VLRGPPYLDGVELAALLDMVRVRCDHGVGHTQTVFGNDSSHFEAIEVLLLHLILRSKASPSAALAMFQSPQQDAVSSPKDCISAALDAITAFTVPNPGGTSQSSRFFQVWSFDGSPR